MKLLHTADWLSMMYPRLKLARNLLRDDGVIFISIDDGEQANLKRMCDEVLGPENSIAAIVWKKKTGSENGIKYVFDEHEFVVVLSIEGAVKATMDKLTVLKYRKTIRKNKSIISNTQYVDPKTVRGVK